MTNFLYIITESLVVILTLYRSGNGMSNITEHCNGIAVLDLSRAIHREGFHREVVINGSIVYTEVESDKIATDQLLIAESFPSSVFVDPYELESKNLHKFIATNKAINLEAPAYKAHPIDVYIYSPVVNGSINIEYPVHLRYHRPKFCYSNSNNFYETIVLPSPKAYMAQKNTGYRCREAITLPCHKNSPDVCHWIPVQPQKGIILSVNVPVGCIEHKIWVVSFTTIVIIAMVVKVGYTVITAQKDKSE